MSFLKWRIAVVAALFGFPTIGSAFDESGIEIKPDRTYVHEKSKSALRVPDGWKVVAPYRLRQTQNASSVLGVDKDDQRVSITIVWSQLIGNDTGTKPNDEEYELLQTVYGKDKVERQPAMLVGPYTVHKILIEDGPVLDDGPPKIKSAGSVYIFVTGSGDNQWKVKVCAVYPMLNSKKYDSQVDEVVKQFFMAE